MSKTMQLYSFDIDEGTIPEMPLYYLVMPERWRNYILQFRKPDSYEYPFKLQVLGKKLEIVFPSILSSHFSNRVLEEGAPWIISIEPLDQEIIKQTCLQWFAIISEKERQEFPVGLLDINDWDWQSLDLNQVNDEGIVYNVIPGLFAHRFCQDPVYLEQAGRHLQFYPVIADKAYECMSEPVEKYGGAYSYVLRLKLVTRGTQPQRKILNIKTGIRRFVLKPVINGNDCYLRENARSSLFVSVNNPYLYINRPTFVKLLAERSKKQDQTKTNWIDGFEKYCSDLVGKRDISTDEIYRNPKKYFKGHHGVKALIVYSPSVIGVKQNIQPGAGLYERRNLFEQFQNKFPNLKVLEPIPELKLNSLKNREPVPEEYDRSYVLEIWSESDEFFLAIITGLTEIFGIQPIQETESKCRFIQVHEETGEKMWEMVVMQRNPQGITSPLDPISKDKARKKRIGEIIRQIEHVKDQPIMAMVEIDDYPNLIDEKMRELDPKIAVRLGMLKTGRITQFIHPLGNDQKENRNRVNNALYDLLSDRGFLNSRLFDVDVDGDLVGFSLLRGTEKDKSIPVMSWISGKDVHVKIGRRQKWQKFHEALFRFDPLSLSQYEIPKKLAEQFITQELTNILHSTQKNVYLFVDAALRNYPIWPGLANKSIELDKLPFQNTFKHQDRLRVIRVNTTEEVPYYDIIKPDGDISKGSGLYKDPIGIYYSVSLRPDTLQTAKIINKMQNPGTMVAKQRAVEIIPLGARSNEERDKLAILTHHLRQVHLPYEFHTKAPYPLQRLKTFEKYAKEAREYDSNYYKDDFVEFADEDQ